jgi:FAD synthetase
MSSDTVVLVGGCFDLIHYGHIFFLTEAAKLGDRLVVLLESDETVRRLKGEGRPFHTHQQRRAMLEALTVVDEIVMLPPMHTDDDYRREMEKIRPDVVAYTEGDPIMDKKKAQAEALGAEVAVIPKTDTPSTTALAKLLDLE